jgi:hypothetical protein
MFSLLPLPLPLPLPKGSSPEAAQDEQLSLLVRSR